MSKDIKDLIDSVEKETKSQAELEQIIHSLKEELDRQEFTIDEQRLLIENLKSQMKDDDLEQVNLPSEVEVLKDIIMTQRKDIEEKDSLIDKLNDKIIEFDTKSEINEEFNSNELLNEEFINAEKLIVQLTDENDQYRNQIEELKQKIEEFQSKEEDIDFFHDEETRVRENEELINFKKLNFQLMQENGLLRVEIESLKSKLQNGIGETSSEDLYNAHEKIDTLTLELEDQKSQIEILNVKLQEKTDDVSSEELYNAKERINALTLEVDAYKAQIKSLEEQVVNLSEPITISTEEALEFAKLREKFDQLNSELQKYQQENKILNEKVLELDKEKKDHETVEVFGTSIPQGATKRIKHTLFNRMYRLLDDENKNKVIDCLISDLKSKNSETKSNAIKILSQIKNDKIYNAFIKIIDDQDWIVRYNLIKALDKFERKTDEFKNLLKKLTKDTDVDVRELAGKILNNCSE
jgi:chromosome segregation ATPase